jgi:hypothetical protein
MGYVFSFVQVMTERMREEEELDINTRNNSCKLG